MWTITTAVFIAAVAVIVLKEIISRKSRKRIFSFYYKKSRMMNGSEQALFSSLQRALGNEYLIFSKVRIEDFVEAKKKDISRKFRWSLRGRIKSRHVDFLICETKTTRPLLAIELDGRSHRKPERRRRDQFVDELYRAVRLPIRHIRVGKNLPAEAEKIAGSLRA